MANTLGHRGSGLLQTFASFERNCWRDINRIINRLVVFFEFDSRTRNANQAPTVDGVTRAIERAVAGVFVFDERGLSSLKFGDSGDADIGLVRCGRRCRHRYVNTKQDGKHRLKKVVASGWQTQSVHHINILNNEGQLVFKKTISYLSG